MFLLSYGKSCTKKDNPYETVPGGFFCPGQRRLKHIPEEYLDEDRGKHHQKKENPESLLDYVEDSLKDLHPYPAYFLYA
jgi:hypothetical protein